MQPRRQNLRTHGFSLIELITVIAIIGIAAAIALPRYGTALSNYRANLAARRLSADIGWALSLAKSSSSTKSIVFNLTANSYQLSGVSDPDHTGAIYSVNLASDPFQTSISSISLSSNGAPLNASSGTATLSFNGYGIPSAGGTIILQSGASQETLTIDGDTGVVSIHP